MQVIWSTNGPEGSENSDVVSNMHETYDLQRQMINSGMSVADLKVEFPYLFQPKYIMDHFKELVGKNAYDTLAASITSKGYTVCNFLCEKGCRQAKHIIKGSYSCVTNEGFDKDAETAFLTLLLAVMVQLQEEHDALLIWHEVGTLYVQSHTTLL